MVVQHQQSTGETVASAAFGREQTARFEWAGVGIEEVECWDPGGLLRVIECTEIEQRFLIGVWRTGTADVFDDTVTAMVFAIFLACSGTEKQGGRRMPEQEERAQGGRTSLQADSMCRGGSFRRKKQRTTRDWFISGSSTESWPTKPHRCRARLRDDPRTHRASPCRGDDRAQLDGEFRRLVRCHIPHNQIIHTTIIVNEPISHAGPLLPLHRREL